MRKCSGAGIMPHWIPRRWPSDFRKIVQRKSSSWSTWRNLKGISPWCSVNKRNESYSSSLLTSAASKNSFARRSDPQNWGTSSCITSTLVQRQSPDTYNTRNWTPLMSIRTASHLLQMSSNGKKETALISVSSSVPCWLVLVTMPMSVLESHQGPSPLATKPSWRTLSPLKSKR